MSTEAYHTKELRNLELIKQGIQNDMDFHAAEIDRINTRHSRRQPQDVEDLRVASDVLMAIGKLPFSDTKLAPEMARNALDMMGVSYDD